MTVNEIVEMGRFAMERVRRRAILAWFVFGGLILASCAPTLLGRAKQSAAVSHTIYESINPQVVDEIEDIVQKSRAGTITAADRERMKNLNELRNILDDYAAAHNLLVEATKTWEATGNEPSNLVLVENQVLSLMNRAIDLANGLGLQVPPGLR